MHKLDYTVAVGRRRKPAIRSKDARVGKVPVDWSETLDNFVEGTEITVRVS